MQIIDFIFPKMCIFCGKIGEDICSSCIKKLPHTLPSCPICNKLSYNFCSHKKCSEENIQCFTGWYITKGIEYILLTKISSLIFSPYIFLLDLLIKYLKIDSIVNCSKVLPKYSLDRKEFQLNAKLANHIGNQYSKNIDILFVGYQLKGNQDIRDNIKRLPLGESLNIRFLILFKSTFIQK